MILGLLALGMLFASAAGAAEPLTARDFARVGRFGAVEISPTGEYLAAAVPGTNETNLAVIRLKDMAVIGGARGGEYRHVMRFWWASPNRILVAIGESDSPLESPQLSGELMAVNADGSQLVYLFGYRADTWGKYRTKQDQIQGFARVIEPRLDGKEALISIARGTSSIGGIMRTAAYRINLLTGRLDTAAPSPDIGVAHYLADASGEVRYAMLNNTETNLRRAYRRDPGSYE